jgi:hypothetical protein
MGTQPANLANPAHGHPNRSTGPLFSCSCPASPRLRSGGVQSLMGCKQYARMLGLSRGYPYILYLSLSKWDAAPFVPFFHKAALVEKSSGTLQPCHPGFAIVRVFPWPARSRSKICGPLTPASQLGPRSGVSDLKGKNFVCPARATSQRRDPWLRRHPQKLHGARSFACRLRIPQDNRLFVRDVHVRAHPGTPGDR